MALTFGEVVWFLLVFYVCVQRNKAIHRHWQGICGRFLHAQACPQSCGVSRSCVPALQNSWWGSLPSGRSHLLVYAAQNQDQKQHMVRLCFLGLPLTPQSGYWRYPQSGAV